MLRTLLGREPVARSRAETVAAARRLQVATVATGCALISAGLGIMAGLGAGVLAAGVFVVAHGLLFVDDGANR